MFGVATKTNESKSNLFQQKVDEAEKEYVAIVWRADQPTVEDSKRLDILLPLLGLTILDFRADMLIANKAKGLQPPIDKVEPARARIREMQPDVDRLETERAEYLRKVDPSIAEMKSEMHRQKSVITQGLDARGELSRLRERNPRVFGDKWRQPIFGDETKDSKASVGVGEVLP